MIEIREFAWSDYDAVVAVWGATGRDVIPRAELEAKLTRDPELFLVAESAGAVMGTYDGRRDWIFGTRVEQILSLAQEQASDQATQAKVEAHRILGEARAEADRIRANESPSE